MASRVLLTGATGFVGKAIARELHEQGHALASLVRGADPSARLERAGVPGRACPGDLDDASAVRAAVAQADVVVHAGAVVDPALQADEAALFRVNRDLAVELGQIAKSEGVCRFVFVSSIAAMGFWSGVATGASVCLPETAYGRAKLEAERALSSLASPSFEVSVLRLPTVYGPGEKYNFLAWVRSVDRGLFRIIGNGENHFPLATTENVARVVCAAADGALTSGAYLVADREPYSMKRIHDAILKALGRAPIRRRIPVPIGLAAGVANEVVHRVWRRVPLVLTRARVRTLTVDQRFDVEPLQRAGVLLDAPLEEWVELTIRDYERRGVLRAAN